MKPKLKIALVVPGLHQSGGIQALGVEIAVWLASRDHQVMLFTDSNPLSQPLTLNIPKEISIKEFHYQEANSTRELLFASDPDLCVILYSWSQALYWLKALNGTNLPLLYSEHSNPTVITKERWNSLERNTLLACSDSVHLLLEEYAASIPIEERGKVRVIPNFCRYPISKIDRTHRTEKKVLSLGRLDRTSKQLHLLIEAFAQIQKKHPHWKLQIWGDGEDHSRLNRLIQKKGLSPIVRLMGKTDDAAVQYREADLFCIPSRFEGFPLALIEANSHGLPAVGFAECSGVNSIIQNGLNGFLAPEMTAESLAQALSLLMGDEELRQKMSDAALDRAADFDRKTILPKWEEMLYDCASHKGNTALQRAMSELNDPENGITHLTPLWRLNASFEERIEHHSDPLIEYVHYKRNRWFVRWPWNIVLNLWKIKERIKLLFQKKR